MELKHYKSSKSSFWQDFSEEGEALEMVESEPEAMVGLLSESEYDAFLCGEKSFLCKSLKSLETIQISQENREELVV